jgi:hypothetical protein
MHMQARKGLSRQDKGTQLHVVCVLSDDRCVRDTVIVVLTHQ